MNSDIEDDAPDEPIAARDHGGVAEAVAPTADGAASAPSGHAVDLVETEDPAADPVAVKVVDAPTDAPHVDRPVKAKPKRKKRFGNRPVFRFTQVTHRWIALISGILILLLVITGAILLYKGPIEHTLNHDSYYPSGAAQTVTAEGALQAVDRLHPKTPANTAVHLPTGNWVVMNSDGDRNWFVDASTARVVREINPNHGFFALLDNIHECALSCEGYPLYVAALGKPIGKPFGAELTWSGLILGTLGIILLVLVVGGLYLWWPGIKKMSRGFKIRRGTRYKFNYDLHKVIGFVALPFLLMWAVTGANFEFPFVSNLWYDVLPGSKPAEVEFATAKPPKGAEPIGDAAALAAIARVRPKDELVAFTRADPSDQTSTYSGYVAHGFDPWGHSDYPGDLGVAVDQFDAATTKVNFTDEFPHRSAELEQQYFGTTHMGFLVNPWWRSIFLLFGLVPILLAVTGVTTWWIRRGKAKAKQQRQRERAAAAAA